MIHFGQRITLPLTKGMVNGGTRMAKPTKKDLDKRRKERDRKRQAVSELARAAGIAPWVEPVRPVPGPHAEFPTWTEPLSAVDSPMERASSADRVKEAIVALNTPPPPPREETEERKQIRGWWREYKDADGETRQQMAREKLAVLNPEDEQFEAFFPDAISEVEPKLGRERYVAFLEEIRDRWPRSVPRFYWISWPKPSWSTRRFASRRSWSAGTFGRCQEPVPKKAVRMAAVRVPRILRGMERPMTVSPARLPIAGRRSCLKGGFHDTRQETQTADGPRTV